MRTAWREAAFTFMPAGGKHLVFLTAATHSTFGGGAAALARAPASDLRHLDCIRAATLAMLDTHLRDDTAANRWMDDGAAVAGWGAAMVRVVDKFGAHHGPMDLPHPPPTMHPCPSASIVPHANISSSRQRHRRTAHSSARPARAN